MIGGDYWLGDFNEVVDKRYVFYVQHGLQEFFLKNARSGGDMPAVIDRLAELITDGAVLTCYTSTVRRKADWSERRALEAIAAGEST